MVEDNEYGIKNEDKERKDEYDIPEVEPGLDERREEPEVDEDEGPYLPPEQIQEIINSIKKEEKEERVHKRKVKEIIKKIHPDK